MKVSIGYLLVMQRIPMCKAPTTLTTAKKDKIFGAGYLPPGFHRS
jgi:hypothetical protein